jgi:phosphoglycerate dehydrogenase-like enzyme
VNDIPTFHVDRSISEADVEYAAGRAALIGPDDAALTDAVAAIIGIRHEWDAERFARFADLRVVSRMGIGYDNVDITAALAADVVVCNAPEAPSVSTAEHTMMLLLSLVKELPAQQTRAEQGSGGPAVATALEIDGATLGLIGLGRIARRVAAAALALGMEVIAVDPALESTPMRDVRLVDLDTLLATSQIISLHAPASDATHHMISTEAFAKMRSGAYLVNCARGSLIDHAALEHALDRGQLAGAGLDVTEPEPLPAGHPLLGRPNVIVTPHVASSTAAGRRRLFEHAFDNALAVVERRPATIVAPPR